MFELFEALVASGSRPVGRGRASNGEQAAWTLALLVFPFLTFAIWTWVAPERDVELAKALLYGLPVGFTLATVWLCRRVGARLSWTIQSAFVCFLLCTGAAFAAAVFSII